MRKFLEAIMEKISSTNIIDRLNHIIDKLKKSGAEYSQSDFSDELMTITKDKLTKEIEYEYKSDAMIMITLSREITNLVKERRKEEWKPKGLFSSNVALKMALGGLK
jgi:anionic cell wall polymer biosynthesis LytR-Cps2A-Psr (LCP) family protein